MQLIDRDDTTFEIDNIQWYGIGAARTVSFVLTNGEEVIIRLSADDKENIEYTFKDFYTYGC